MTIKKIIAPLFIVFVSVFGVGAFLTQDKNTVNSSSTNTNNSDLTDQQNLDQVDASSVTFQKLAILPNRCRGCGKCTRLDPAHFEMSGSKAIVISSTNLDSTNLTNAINNCHDQAIILS